MHDKKRLQRLRILTMSIYMATSNTLVLEVLPQLPLSTKKNLCGFLIHWTINWSITLFFMTIGTEKVRQLTLKLHRIVCYQKTK